MKIWTIVRKFFFKIILIAVSCVSLFPFYYLFIMSSYFNEDILKKGVTLIPGTYLLENLKTILMGNYTSLGM